MSGHNIPITWRNVTVPNFSGTLSAIERAGQGLGESLKGLGGNVQDFAENKQKQETDEFIAHLNSLGSDEERNQAVAEAEQGFLDLGKVNTAVTDAQNQDLDIQKQEQDLTFRKEKRLEEAQTFSNKQEEIARRIEAADLQIELAENDRDLKEEKRLRTRKTTLQKEANALGAAEDTARVREDKAFIRDTSTAFFQALKEANTFDAKVDALSAFEESTRGRNMSEEARKKINRERAILTNTYTQTLKGSVSTSHLDLVKNGSSFSAQDRMDLEDSLAENIHGAIPGLSIGVAREQAEILISKNAALSGKFAEAERKAKIALALEGITATSVLNQYGMDQEQLDRLNAEPLVFIPDRIARRLERIHKDKFDADDREELQTTVTATVEAIRSSLDFSNVTLADQGNINLGILKYVDSIQFTPDELFSTNPLFRDFEIDGNEVSSMKPHELLQGLQKAFPSTSKIGKSLDIVLPRTKSKTKAKDTDTKEKDVSENIFTQIAKDAVGSVGDTISDAVSNFITASPEEEARNREIIERLKGSKPKSKSQAQKELQSILEASGKKLSKEELGAIKRAPKEKVEDIIQRLLN